MSACAGGRVVEWEGLEARGGAGAEDAGRFEMQGARQAAKQMDDALLACAGVVVVGRQSECVVKDRTFLGWGGKQGRDCCRVRAKEGRKADDAWGSNASMAFVCSAIWTQTRAPF